MSERGEVRVGATVIPYTIARSHRRRKTVAITVDGNAGVRIAAPTSVSRARIEEIVVKRAVWIARRVSTAMQTPRPRHYVSGEMLPYLGRQARLFVGTGDVRHVNVRFINWTFDLTVPSALNGEDRRTAIENELTRWYMARAAEYLNASVNHWAALGGYSPGKVLIRAQRRRWGSCSQDGTLRFNWRLVLAPPALIDYVVVHELAHLRVRNHSAAFWAEVARLIPEYPTRRARLTVHEPSLTL